MKKDTTIWILEDDAASRFVLEEILGLRYPLRYFHSLKELKGALEKKPSSPPGLLIADLRLPDNTFLSFLSSEGARAKLTFPFFVVSSVDDLDALRLCYSLGAADYLTKPFGKAEIIVKIERLLNVDSNAKPKFRLDPISFRLTSGEKVSDPLTQKEFQILSCLLKNPGFSRDQILESIWAGTRVETKTIDVHVSSLRKKLSSMGLGIRIKPEGALELIQG